MCLFNQKLLKVTLLFFCFLIFCVPVKACKIIHIRTQNDFNNIQELVSKAIISGDKKITINFSSKEFWVQENHIRIKGMSFPDVKLSFFGNGATLVPEGRTYQNGDKYEGVFSLNNSWMNDEQDISIWSSSRYADGIIEVINKETRVCRLKSKEALPQDNDCESIYILIPQWYLSSVYKVKKIEGMYIYFTADDLTEKSYRGGWSVNNDYNYGRENIRYKLCNVNVGDDNLKVIDNIVCLPSGVKTVREGKTHRYFTIEDCAFKSLEIDGFKIYGNRNEETSPALFLNRVNCDITIIRNNIFKGLRSNVIKVASSPNVVIENNEFSDCYLQGIRSDNYSSGTVIKDNHFNKMGKRMLNSFCVLCQGTGFLVKGNSFVDFGYGGIGAGLWFMNKMDNPCSGSIDCNELYYSSSYTNNNKEYSIMDGGAIYLWTKCNGVIIRNNYIHDIAGIHSNRGIFCDDGAFNFEIVGNVVVRVNNSYCIDSRRVSSVEEFAAKGSGIEKSNVNITIKDNIVDGKIRFVANEVSDNNCHMGTNYVLCTKNDSLPSNEVGNISDVEKSLKLECISVGEANFKVSKKSYKEIKNNKELKRILSRFTKGKE